MEALSQEDLDRFRALQATLVPNWPQMTMRRVGDAPRTLVVINSINVNLPAHFQPVVPAYEERFLFLMLAAVRNPGTRVIYVTSQPVLPRLVRYYLSLMPGASPKGIEDRIHLVSVSDGSSRPLVDKLLSRPLLLDRLRTLAGATPFRVVFPFNTTEKEVLLGNTLNTPVYGPDPSLVGLGTKSGSRRVFAAAGLPYPAGAEDLRSVEEIVEVIGSLRSRNPLLASVMVKLDDSAGGIGNAMVRLEGAESREAIRSRVEQLELEDEGASVEEFFADFTARGGIVEARIEGEDFRSPSVQLRASPLGAVEILSTHDQVLGGRTGQTFLGCRFPADSAYGSEIARLGHRAGVHLAEQGVIGRFGIDFVVVRRGDKWYPYAIEINLRNGGTTHPMLTLGAVTDGEFDPATNAFPVDGGERFYLATDHLESDWYRSLTPDDLLDHVSDPRLTWSEESKSGVVLHLVSAIAVAGRLGMTAIGTSREDAERRFRAAQKVIEELCQFEASVANLNNEVRRGQAAVTNP